jgi:hypothetical protein
MSRIQLTDTLFDAVDKLSGGNPGAITALAQLYKSSAEIDPDSALGGLGVLLDFDTLNITGSRIWMLWKDVCDQDAVKANVVLRSWQLGFLPEADLHAAIDGVTTLDIPALHLQVYNRLTSFRKPESAL